MGSEMIEHDFEEFWNAYPKRTGRIAAFKQYQCAVYYSEATHASIMAGLEAYKNHLRAAQTEFQFIVSPQRWLADGRWEDEYELNLPKQEIKSSAEMQKEARLQGFYKTGFWVDTWGERPGPNLKLVG